MLADLACLTLTVDIISYIMFTYDTHDFTWKIQAGSSVRTGKKRLNFFPCRSDVL
jgi:hypothetical protein